MRLKGTAMIDHIIGWSLPVIEEIEITDMRLPSCFKEDPG